MQRKHRKAEIMFYDAYSHDFWDIQNVLDLFIYNETIFR